MIESQLLPAPPPSQQTAAPSTLYNTSETVRRNFRMENEHPSNRERSPATNLEPADNRVELGRTEEPDDEDDQYDDRSHSSSELNHEEDAVAEHVENGQDTSQRDGKWELNVRSPTQLAAAGEIGPDYLTNTGGNEHLAQLKSSPTSDSADDAHPARPGKPHGPNPVTKTCAKKSFVWKYFRHPELITGVTDRSRTQCILCESQLAFNASGTTTTMLNHLKSRHGNVAEQEEFQRRHTRPKAATVSANQSPQMEADADKSGDLFYAKHVKPSRSPTGQRAGRSAGLARRQKLSKSAIDAGEPGPLFANGQIKLDPNLLFPMGCYPDLNEHQHRALITEMLHSTAGVMANGRDPTAFNPFHEPHQDLGAMLSGAGIRQPNGRRLDTNESPSAALLNHNNTNGNNNSNKLFSSPSLFNRATFLHAVNAFSSGLPFAVANPLALNPTGMPQNDLSPTASSGLGVSVSSPSGATTTSSTSPISSTENGHLTSPPTTHPPHWVPRQTHTKSTDPHGPDCDKNDEQQSRGTEPTDLSAVSGMANRTDCSTEPTCLVTEKLAKVHGTMLHRDSTFGLVQQPNTVVSNSPVDLAGAFGNAMNLATPIDSAAGAIPYARFDPFTGAAQQQQQQQMEQEKQHQWLTNAWLSGLANGKALHYPGAFMSPSVMMNFLNGTGASQTQTHTASNELYPKTATNNDMACTTDCGGTKDMDSWTVTQSSSLCQLPPNNQSLPVPARLLDWSRLGQPGSVSAFLAAQSMLSGVPMTGFADCSWSMLSEPPAPTSNSPRNPIVEGFDSVVENGAKHGFSKCLQSDSEETLDLSKPTNTTAPSPQCSSVVQSISHTKVPDDAGNVTVSMKRKRARPVYISPDGNTKRPNVEPTGSSELQTIHEAPMDVEDAANPTSRQAFTEQVARYLVQDMLPPEVADGEGFKVLMGFLAHYSPPSARELRDEVFPRAVLEMKNNLDAEVAEFVKRNSASELADGRSFTVALSAELWPNAAPVLDQDGTGSVREMVHLNLGVQGLDFQTPLVMRQMRDCFAITDPRTLETKLTECVQSIPSPAQPPQSNPLPIPVVTNRARDLDAMLHSVANSGQHGFVVIPCFVSELASSVQTGLNSGLVKSTLVKCRTPHTSLRNEPALVRPPEAPISWSEAFSITQSCLSTLDLYELTTEETDLLKQLQTVLETLNQTLQLLRQKDLKLTASMIDPILHTLTGTHLTSEADPAEAGDQHDFRTALVEFKRLVRSQLTQSYPLTGNLRDVLHLSSLLDPRFKDHMNEREPSALSLLKEKVEDVPSETVISDHSSTDATNTSPPKSTASTTEELQTVFGLRPYSRAALSEVDRYLREDPIGLEQDPFTWWAEKRHAYPRVAVLASYYLNIPLTCFAPERLQTALDQSTRFLSEKHALLEDELGLPNLVDPLAAGRRRISPGDQKFYNLLWHQWAVPRPL